MMSSKRIVEAIEGMIASENQDMEQVKVHIAELRILGDTQREQDHRKYLSGSQRVVSALSVLKSVILGELK